MSGSAMLTCMFCGQAFHNSGALAAFAEDRHCDQCGLSASEGNLKMQEDLVALFARQMRVDTPVSREKLPSGPSSITYSITQHYHHSSHVTRAALPAESSKQDVSPSTASNSMNEILRLQNINPSSLSPTQLRLFENAMPEQRSRLIQIWQIYPESSGVSNKLREYQSTTNMHAGALGVDMTSHSGSNQPAQMTYSDDFEMCDQVREGSIDDDGLQYAEPYMVSGYEILAQRDYELSADKIAPSVNEPTTGSPYKLANDPIYGTQGHRWWERSNSDTLKYQYGAFQEMNRHGDYGLVQPSWLA
ncbi:hypothetical protein BBP40_003651 [Aspergillus hancockii]|nr:hypothetical protein BBP40_003651 [Aspergillus hancockii]